MNRKLNRRLLLCATTLLLLLGVNAQLSGGEPIRGSTAAITIFDQNGNPAPNAAPSAASQTFDVTVAPSGMLIFLPSTVNIFAGDTVRWTWASSNHNVRGGNPCTASGGFCSTSDTNCTSNPLLPSGTMYSHTFSTAGTFNYFCSAHCANGMTGTVVVAVPFVSLSTVVYSGTGFVISGKTMPNRMVTIQAATDIVSGFAPIGMATADNSGNFNFTDASATSLTKRFYRAIYP